ncbi:U4/U6 snRNP-specific spliceosomal protein, partial [Neoconidiobolus thromboides FSU 785]
RASLEQQQLLEEFERNKRAKSLTIPTDDNKVKAKLRELKEPITLFGERPGDRRARLRTLLTGDNTITIEDEAAESSGSESGEFFTYGSEYLRQSRVDIGLFSLPRAHERLKFEASEEKRPIAHGKALRQDLFKYLKTYGNYSSQVGDERPLTQCKFSPDSKMLLTGSWNGNCKLWSIPESKHIMTFRGHTDRLCGIAFHPKSTISQSKSEVNFATGSSDNLINLWGLEKDTPIETLSGHQSRVSRVEFHPSGKYLASSSFDTTWRLWDVHTNRELLLQEGHSREVYNLSFQADGSLIATGGLDAIGRVWDLRNGKSIMDLKGHVKEILGIDFSPNGHEIATSSEDNTIKIWDVRKLSTIYTIPAHKSIVSDVKYYHGDVKLNREHVDPDTKVKSNMEIPINGLYLVSSSFDGMLKMWSADDYRLIHAISAHDGKVMGFDVAPDNKVIVTAGYDRTFKLWSSDEVPL